MTKTTTDMNDKLTLPDMKDTVGPPETEIRTDLWPTMSASQLYRQQEMVLTNLTKLQSMTSYGVAPTPGCATLMAVMQQAILDLTHLIERKTETVQRPRKTTDGQ